MDVLALMKGKGREVARLWRNATIYRLVFFGDGSKGIFRNDAVLGIWEPEETGSCLHMFIRLTGSENDVPTLWPQISPVERMSFN